MATQPPTIIDTIHLFTLSPDQQIAFLRWATILDAEHNGQRVPQLRMVLSGEAGCGKSRVIKALLWYAFQTHKTYLIAATAYTWRAAVPLSTPDHPGVSTSCLFGINPVKNNTLKGTVFDLQSMRLRMARIIIIDEMSQLAQDHVAAMSYSARRQHATTALDGTITLHPDPFAGKHTIISGEQGQLPPPTGTPLYRLPHSLAAIMQGTPKQQRLWFKERTGWELYQQFNEVIWLHNQHRIATDDDLLKYADLLRRPEPPTLQEVG